MTTPQPLIDIPATPPPVNPLDIAKKVAIGQLLEVTSDDNLNGTKLRITEDGTYEALADAYDDSEIIVTITAECRACHWTAESSDDDLSAIQFRVWNHEHDFPGHFATFINEVTRG